MIDFGLRDYQQRGVEQIRAAFQTGFRAPLYQCPTGGGKTHDFTYITYHGAKLGTRICIVVHRRELWKQASKSLEEYGVPHGIIAPGHPRTEHIVQVASIQTLVRRKGYDFDLLILDEAHHAVSETYSTLFSQYPNAAILGVTATPCRMSGRGLGTVFDHLIVGPSVRELVDSGYLARPKVYAPSNIDVSKLKSTGGDYNKEELAALIDKRSITGCAVEHYKRLADGLPTIVFCASVEHAEHVAEDFRAAGYRFESVDGSMPTELRDSRIAGLANGRLNGITSCELISEGLNVPGVACAILLRPTKSLTVYLQQVGRALRPYPGKTCAIILDHVGNVFRHGVPDADREWSLEEGIKKRTGLVDDVPTRQCDVCFAVHPLARKCPECGYIYPVATVAPPKTVEGELKLVTPEEGTELYKAAKSLKDFHRWAKATGKTAGAAWVHWKKRLTVIDLERRQIRAKG